MPLSRAAEEILRGAGWHPDRRVDTAGWEAQLAREGHKVEVAQRIFLEQFGGLVMDYPHPRDPRATRHLTFDPFDEGLYPEEVRWFEERLGEPLVPVGRVGHHMTLLMSPAGRMYGEVDTVLYLIGEHMEDAVERLCSCQQAGQLPN